MSTISTRWTIRLKTWPKPTSTNFFIVHYDDVKDLPYESLLGLDQRALPGEGVADLKGILSTLYRIGYRGPFSIELFNEEMTTWDPEEFASVAKQKAEEVLDKYFN